MPDVGSVLISRKNAVLQASAWVWLVDIDLDGTNGARLCDGDSSFTYSGATYSAFPLQVDGFDVSTDGALPQPTVVISNIGGEAAGYILGGGVVDREVRIRLATRADTSSVIDFGRWVALDAVLSLDTVTLPLGPYPILDAPFPALKQLRTRCQKVYGGTDCQYNTALPNLISGTHPSFDPATCDYGLDTGNGCRAHGENEAANGAAKKHPGRWGGFAGIPKGDVVI